MAVKLTDDENGWRVRLGYGDTFEMTLSELKDGMREKVAKARGTALALLLLVLLTSCQAAPSEIPDAPPAEAPTSPTPASGQVAKQSGPTSAKAPLAAAIAANQEGCHEFARGLSSSWSAGIRFRFMEGMIAGYYRDHAADLERLRAERERLQGEVQTSGDPLLIDLFAEQVRMCQLAADPAGYTLLTYNAEIARLNSEFQGVKARADATFGTAPPPAAPAAIPAQVVAAERDENGFSDTEHLRHLDAATPKMGTRYDPDPEPPAPRHLDENERALARLEERFADRPVRRAPPPSGPTPEQRAAWWASYQPVHAAVERALAPVSASMSERATADPQLCAELGAAAGPLDGHARAYGAPMSLLTLSTHLREFTTLCAAGKRFAAADAWQTRALPAWRQVQQDLAIF